MGFTKFTKWFKVSEGVLHCSIFFSEGFFTACTILSDCAQLPEVSTTRYHFSMQP